MKTIWLLILGANVLFSCKPVNNTETEAAKSPFYILYVGTYTNGESKGIYVYEMDRDSGKLTYVSASPFTMNPSYLDITSDGRFLFSVNETGSDTSDGQVSSFRITDQFKKLEFVNQVSSEGDFPCYIALNESASCLFVANYGTGNVAVIPFGSDGSLKAASYTHKHEGKGLSDRQESAHAHSISLSPDGKYAYSNDLGTDKIYIYKISGSETVLSSTYKSATGSGPRHLAFHPSMNFLYSINELNGTIDCLRRDTVTGNLSHLQTISTVGDTIGTEAGSADIHITPDGEFLYATNRGNFNSIAMYRINNGTGILSFIGIESVKGSTPRNFAIDPSGTFLLVANQNSNQIVTFKIDPITGRLVETGINTEVPSPVCIRFLPVHLMD